MFTRFVCKPCVKINTMFLYQMVLKWFFIYKIKQLGVRARGQSRNCARWHRKINKWKKWKEKKKWEAEERETKTNKNKVGKNKKHQTTKKTNKSASFFADPGLSSYIYFTFHLKFILVPNGFYENMYSILISRL